MNNEGKIQLEDTANESTINGSGRTKENVREITFNDSRNISDSSLIQQISENIRSDETPSDDLLFNDQENFEISENHSINNNINNNNNRNIPNNDSAIDYMRKFSNRDVANKVNDIDNTRLHKNPNTNLGRLVGSLFLMNRGKTRKHKIIT